MKKKMNDTDPGSAQVGSIPVNLTLAPALIQPVATVTAGATPPTVLPIMREGFITETGFLPYAVGPAATAINL